MAANRPAEKKENKREESQAEKDAKAHAKVRANADKLRKSIASIIYQTEIEMGKRKDAEEKAQAAENKAAQDEGRAPNPISLQETPPLLHPLTQYGYENEGPLKDLMKKMKEAVTEVKGGMRDARGAEIDVKDQKNITTAGLLDNEVKTFEQDIRNLQNGWMIGQPVEPDALKRRVREFEQRLTAFQPPDGKHSQLVNEEKLKTLKERVADFPATIDKTLEILAEKAQQRAHSNKTFILNKEILEQQVFHQKLTSESVKEGKCDFIRYNAVPDLAAAMDNEAIKLNAGSKRAYLLVNTSANPDDPLQTSLYYINRATQECTLVCAAGSAEMKALQAEMLAGDEIGVLKKGYSKLTGQEPLTSLPIQRPGIAQRPGTVLTAFQEDRIREVTHHQRKLKDVRNEEIKDWKASLEVPTKSFDLWHFMTHGEYKKDLQTVADWKDVLPIAYDEMKFEKDLRSEEEKNFGAEVARDKAIERLIKRSDDDSAMYLYAKDKFSIQRQKDENGRTIFTVSYEDRNKKNLPEAMAALVNLCYQRNPLCPVVLSCNSLQGVEGTGFAEDIAKQVEHAIIAAEKARASGIYIPIKLSSNVQTAISAAGMAHLNLGDRAKSLYEDWKKHVADSKAQEELKAEERFAVKADGLGMLLAAKLPNSANNEVKGGVGYDANVMAKFSTKELDAKGNEKRMDEVQNEVNKLQVKVKQLSFASQSIHDQLNALAKEVKEMKNPEQHGPRLAEIAATLTGLKESQNAVNSELAKIAGFEEKHQQDRKDIRDQKALTDIQGNDLMREKKESKQLSLADLKGVAQPVFIGQSGTAANYGQWLGSLAMKGVLGINQGMIADNTPAAIKYKTIVKQVDEVGDQAAQQYNTNFGQNANLQKLLTLHEQIKTYQEAAEKAAAQVQQPPQAPRIN